jgi:hypothetical protein
MKKIIFLMVICLGLCASCSSKKDEKRPLLLPTDVVSLTEAQELIADEYTITMKNDAVIQKDNKTEVTYLSEPLGYGDSIKIEVFTTDEANTAESIKEEFSLSKNKRSDFIRVEGLGEDAYITYPSLHMYLNGVYVKITAGSGASEAQSDILVELGKIAEKNIENYFNLR